MISRIGNTLASKMVEGRFLCYLFWLLYKLITGIITLVYKIVTSVLKLVLNLGCKILSYPDKVIAVLARRVLAKRTPVKNQVMFLTFLCAYTCNPKYIAEELIKAHTGARLVWDVKSAIPHSDDPIELQFVRHNSYEFFKELGATKVIVENTNIVERLYAY